MSLYLPVNLCYLHQGIPVLVFIITEFTINKILEK